MYYICVQKDYFLNPKKLNQMSKFKEFQSRPVNGGIQYEAFFPNGYGVSVVKHEFSYGGRLGLWELAVLQGGADDCTICYDSPITDDVIGHLTEEQVDGIVTVIQELPAYQEPTDMATLADQQEDYFN